MVEASSRARTPLFASIRISSTSCCTMIDPRADFEVAATGLNASPGAASGKAVFDADTAVEWTENGEDVILVRWETTPDDIHGMIAAKGILTAHGGMTSRRGRGARHGHAVRCGLRGALGGCEGEDGVPPRQADRRGRRAHARRRHGARDPGPGRSSPPQIEDFETILGWADSMRRLKVPPTRMPLRTPPRPASSARRASVSVTPSTCSWPTTGCPSCAR